MRTPSWVFDARSIVNPHEVINSGINLWRVEMAHDNFDYVFSRKYIIMNSIFNYLRFFAF